MLYQINHYVLNLQTRTLSNADVSHHIRPKTLAVLMYLAERSGQIISKNELLEVIWDDVNVDDGVIFQSIREIRQLFADSNIIQNHPRKGYAFTATLNAIAAEPPLQEHLSEQNIQPNILALLRQHWRIYAIIFIAILMTFLIHLLTLSNDNPSTEESQLNTLAAFEQNIIVLPIKDKIAYGEHDWVYLGGMEQLIANLKALPSTIYIHDGIRIPQLMRTAGLSRNFTSAETTKLFTTTGATLIIESELHGNISDYKLVYKFHVKNDVKQGIILNTDIKSALAELAQKVAEFTQHPLQRNADEPAKEFSDALFAQAMINYEKDWQSSISFFESYLALNPNSVIASIYLSKLYLWNKQYPQAQTLIKQTEKIDNISQKNKAELYLIKGRIASQQKSWQQAEQYFNQASSAITNQPEWYAKASIAEARGLNYLAQNLLVESAIAFNKAIELNQITQSPIGTNSNKLHLAYVLHQQGKLAAAQHVYQQAKQQIETTQLEFLYSMLASYSNKLHTKDLGVALK